MQPNQEISPLAFAERLAERAASRLATNPTYLNDVLARLEVLMASAEPPCCKGEQP